MKNIYIKEFEETFVIHFGSKFETINAYTLASTLVSLANSAKEANSIVNPGYEVEIVVEAIGPGSFRTKIKTIYTSLESLFSKQNLKTIVLAIIASYIYENTLSPESKINIKVDQTNVIIENENQKIIIPKEIYDALEEVKKSERFKRNIDETFETLNKDEHVESLGFTKNMSDQKPIIEIPRERFPKVIVEEDTETTKVITETADLKILKAILDRGKRKWEFVWQGVKISAPVLHNDFYDRFFDHEITIAPGDSLKARIKIHQTKDEDTGIYTNQKYEIIEVIKHIPRFKQSSFDID